MLIQKNSLVSRYKNKVLLIIIFIIILCIVFITLFYYYNYDYYYDYTTNLSKFDDTPNEIPITTQSIKDQASSQVYGPDGQPEMEESKGCEANGDMVGICMDYNNCCNNTVANKCYCEHPFLVNCKAKYDECISANVSNLSPNNLKLQCLEQNKDCCKLYNNIEFDSDNFKAPVINNQTTGTICKLSAITNLNQKCMELCQTEPKCKGYSVESSSLGEINCSLHSIVSFNPPKIDSSTGKKLEENPQIKYYVKK
jgi:hypothetical protein